MLKEAHERSNALTTAREEMVTKKDFWSATNYCIRLSNLDDQVKANRKLWRVIDNIWTAL